uniref:triacylglycerol lipase n=1 Tax=Yarrowia phangngaensis TaxID=444778 RepID=A0A078BNT5_9ASCO|nr:lipase [Yarrowia phangngaensis]
MLIIFLLTLIASASPFIRLALGEKLNQLLVGSHEAFESEETQLISPEFQECLIRYMWFNNVAPCVPKQLEHPFVCAARGCKMLGKYTELVDIFTHSESRMDMLTDRTITGFVALDHLHKEIVLVLRGTQDVNDWLTNLQVSLVGLNPADLGVKSLNCPNCRVGLGVLSGYISSQRVADPIIRRLKEKFPQYQLVVTGHSLGGTAATLFGLNYQLNGLSPKVFSVGAPALGNKEFTNFVDEVFWGSEHPDTLSVPEKNINFTRVTHLGDFIPRFPFWKGYQQMSGELFIHDVKGIDPPLDKLRRCNGQQNRKCSFGDKFRQLTLNIRSHSAYLVPRNRCSGERRKIMGDIGAYGNDTVLIPVVDLDSLE